jgi:hypothetical protein
LRLARWVLALSGVPFVAIGLAFLVDPAAMGAHIGLALADATAANDVRAVYGGLQVGLGALLWACASRARWVTGGVAALLATFGGLVAGRVVSLLVDGMPAPLGLLLHAGELAGLLGGIAAAAALARARRPTRESASAQRAAGERSPPG